MSKPNDNSVPLKQWMVALCCLFAMVLCGSVSAQTDGGNETKLYLVSVGTGDAGNITVKAIDTIKKASVIFCSKHIRQTFPEMLEGKELHTVDSTLVHRNAMRNDGKDKEAQKEMARVSGIVRKAAAEGKVVAVLDNGDPTIYGPNMWFVDVFSDLNPRIIPGVSSFNAANAALKKGITSGLSTRSAILTNGSEIDMLAQNKTTMVFFTMNQKIGDIVESLLKHYPQDTPIALVKNAGFDASEEVIIGNLKTIPEIVKGRDLGLHLIYVGDFLKNKYAR